MKNDSVEKKDVYLLLKLTMPFALIGLVRASVWFFETLFLAQLGEKILAAGALVSWFFATLAVILFGTLSAINILIAHKHGENDRESIALIARDGIFLALLLSAPAFALLWNMPSIFLLLGQSPEIVAISQLYLHALAWGILPNLVMVACLGVFIGIGQTRIALTFSVISVALSIATSYVLIFGAFGFTALGVAGAGWAVTISYWFAVVLLIMYIICNNSYRNYFRYVFKIKQLNHLPELLRVGIPLGAMHCVEVAFFLALTMSMGLLGSQVQAANQVVLQYLGLLMTIMFSIAQAITMRIGHLLGAKEFYLAEKTAYIGIGLAAGLAALVSAIYWTAPLIPIGLDFNIHDPANFELIDVIKQFLVICAIFQIFEASRIAYFGALRGFKDTQITLFASVMSFWCIAMPMGSLCTFYFKLGAISFWWGMVIGAIMSFMLLHFRFRSKISKLKMTSINLVEQAVY